MKYQDMIGDGKFPNKYWVFHYDEKFTRKDDELLPLNDIGEKTKDNLLGEFKTYQEALRCVDDKAYYPHVVIEDRLSGQVFERLCVVCSCCGKEDWETWDDIHFTEKTMREMGVEFK
jgi:hypothetical protein